MNLGCVVCVGGVGRVGRGGDTAALERLYINAMDIYQLNESPSLGSFMPEALAHTVYTFGYHNACIHAFMELPSMISDEYGQLQRLGSMNGSALFMLYMPRKD